MKITPSDIDWLSANYPELRININDKNITIEGNLVFFARYNNEDGTYIINPTTNDEFTINDSYGIEICIFPNSNRYPLIKETTKRLSTLAKSKKTDPRNLHVYFGLFGFLDDSLCTVGPIDQELIKTNLLLQDLVERILIPFFYDSSYYEKYNVRLRSDYSHEIWGLIENYFEYSGDINDEIKNFVRDKIEKSKQWVILKEYFLNNKVIKGHSTCMVCKNPKIRDCHSRVFRGIRKIQDDKIFFNSTQPKQFGFRSEFGAK